MKLLVAGCGSIGHRHLRNLATLGERDVVLYRSGLATATWDDLAGLPVETSLDAALSHRPDAVIVSNPTALHLDVAIPALRAGCALLLEKPISHSVERLEELVAAARGGSRVLVGFQYRFHPAVRKAAALLREGAIGRAISARATYGDYLPDWHPWEDYRRSYGARADLGGGVALTLCHPFDYLRWLLGDVVSVRGFSGTLGDLELEPGVEDTCEAVLTCVSGAVASVNVNFWQRPPAHHFEIAGTAGTLRWNEADQALRLHRGDGSGWQVFPAPDGFDRNDMFLEEMRHFLRVARGEEAPACTLRDGIEALRLALEIRDLGRRGQGGPVGAPRPAGAGRPLPAHPALVVLDFDGVMTDNRVWVDASGNELVAASRSDGLGLDLLRRLAGVEVVVLSAEVNRVVSARCAKLGIEAIQGQKDKGAALRDLLARRGLDPAAIVYAGNDVNDLGCFEIAGCCVAPADAHEEVLRRADVVLRSRGGHGAVRELCDMFLAGVGQGKG